MKSKRGNIVLIIVLAVGLLVAVSGLFYYLGSQKAAPSLTPATNTQPATAENKTPSVPLALSPSADVIESKDPADPNIKTFTSAKLGISFNFLETQNGEKFSAKAVGNRVYVFQTKFPMEQGQYVEVYSKNSSDNLKTAIENKFLPSYSPNDCFVKLVDNPVAKQPTPANFVLAEIQVPTTQNDDMGTLSVKWDKCPSPYTSTNGIAYFAYDPAHADKFVFFSIGQYSIDGGPNNLLWQTTIKFL